MGKLSERLLLREKEAEEFSTKYEKAMSESNILKDQLDKLGSELTTELDNEKKENESQKVNSMLVRVKEHKSTYLK